MIYAPHVVSWIDLLLGCVGIFALLFLLLWLYEKWIQKQLSKEIATLLKTEKALIERKSEAISQILLELGPPQLEDQKTRLEISRRLYIALFGR